MPLKVIYKCHFNLITKDVWITICLWGLCLLSETVIWNNFHVNLLQLYPSFEAERYSGLMEDLQRFAPTTPRPGHIHHGTANLHPILVSLERYYHSLDAVDDSYDDLNLPQGERGQTSKNSNPYHLIENIFHNSSNKDSECLCYGSKRNWYLQFFVLGCRWESCCSITTLQGFQHRPDTAWLNKWSIW